MKEEDVRKKLKQMISTSLADSGPLTSFEGTAITITLATTDHVQFKRGNNRVFVIKRAFLNGEK